MPHRHHNLLAYNQTQTFYRVPDSLVVEFNSGRLNNECDTSLLSLKESDFIPISYNFLDSNGFCYDIDPILQNFTLSFTFTAINSSVFINTGYSIVACTNISFSNVTLYDNTNCVNIGTGFVYSNLQPGNMYTWTITGEATGIFCEGFSTICPYYVNIGGLPIELISFTATLKSGFVYVKWITGSETNVNYFILERSADGFTKEYIQLHRETSRGNTPFTNIYEFLDKTAEEGINYYRIKEVDYNGNEHYYYPISINHNPTESNIIKVIDINGKAVDINRAGYKIIIYESGTTINKYIIQ